MIVLNLEREMLAESIGVLHPETLLPTVDMEVEHITEAEVIEIDGELTT
jgi:hypothetical protein